MLRVESSKSIKGFTEFEEDIHFDEDDPDFDTTVPFVFKGSNIFFQKSAFAVTERVASNMSLVEVHPRELHSSHGSSLSSLSYSLDDITSCCSPQFNSEHVMTIEELRLQMTSCFTCGVSWAVDHVSLDCTECGGYALERPCPSCDGSCGAVWKRDLTKSHASSKARWEGECNRSSKQQQSPKTFVTNNSSTQELCSKLEKLSSHS